MHLAQLRLYTVQRPLEAQPEIVLLRWHAAGNDPRELGRRLDGFDS